MPNLNKYNKFYGKKEGRVALQLGPDFCLTYDVKHFRIPQNYALTVGWGLNSTDASLSLKTNWFLALPLACG